MMIVELILSGALILAALPPAVPNASASPAPSTAALKVIANVRSTPRCAEIVTHANSAISAALNDDMLIGQTITRLRYVTLDDGNIIHRRNALNALGDLAKQITQQSRAADDEVKRLRALAAQSTDPQVKQELKQFADELGGALWRQQKVARDLNGYLAAVDFQDMAAFDEAQQNANIALFGTPDLLAQNPVDPRRTVMRGTAPGGTVHNSNPTQPVLGHDPNQATATEQAHAAADDFQQRLPLITIDENNAATHVQGALAGC